MQKKDEINKIEVINKVKPVIEQVAKQQGLIVLEINFIKEAGNWHLKIFIYNPDHPITHEDCQNMTRGLSDYLDQIISVPYYLEISSPGIERKLKSSLEYNIFRGEKVEIKLKQTQDELKKFLAKIIEYSPETGLKVEVLETGKVINIKENNISSIKLKADF